MELVSATRIGKGHTRKSNIQAELKWEQDQARIR